MRRWVLFPLLSLLFATAQAEQSAEFAWQHWRPIGTSSLTWGFWDIYDCALYSPTGLYTPNELALVIDYKRNIDADALLDATLKQWRHLDYSNQQITNWKPMLSNAWPSVKKGDKLIYRYQHQGVFFYQALNKEPIEYHKIVDPDLAKAFINIWLSPKTSYPKMRQELIGEKK